MTHSFFLSYQKEGKGKDLFCSISLQKSHTFCCLCSTTLTATGDLPVISHPTYTPQSHTGPGKIPTTSLLRAKLMGSHALHQCLCLLLLPTLPYQSAERASSRQRKVAQSPLLIWLRCFLWYTDFGV